MLRVALYSHSFEAFVVIDMLRSVVSIYRIFFLFLKISIIYLNAIARRFCRNTLANEALHRGMPLNLCMIANTCFYVHASELCYALMLFLCWNGVFTNVLG